MASLGSRFRARREEQGCTLDDIAARTKIPRRLLVDLEGNTFTHWHASRVYRIGYLRAYAAAVGLDTAEVIAQFDAENGPSHPSADADRRAVVHARRPVSTMSLALTCALAGTLLIGVRSYVGPAEPVAAQGVVAAPALTDSPAGPEGPHDVAPPSVETTAVPTSGGLVVSDDVEGELLIESEPAGTHVVVNGIGRGTTPIRLRYLPIGSYTIRLVRDGYQSQEVSATLTNERPVRSLSIALDPKREADFEHNFDAQR